MAELPDEVVEEAERLTRLARSATDPDEAAVRRDRRAALLADHGFTARVREADDVLVLHPAEWVESGTVRRERVEDVSRAVEVALSTPGPADDWAAVARHNDAVADAVRAAHGDVHGATARAFADFMSNHRARRVETATAGDFAEFRDEYFRRNAWPTDEQAAVLPESLSLVGETAERVAEDERGSGGRENREGAATAADRAPGAGDRDAGE